MSARPISGLAAHARHASELVDPEDAIADECPRSTGRSKWSLLEVLGAGALTVWWLYLLWRVIDGLAGPL